MTRSELLAVFCDVAAEVTERDFRQVGEASEIAELGIDSLGMLEIVGSLERELQVQAPDAQLVGVRTVAQLLEIFERRFEVQRAGNAG